MEDLGASANAENGSRASMEPASSLHPTGFDPARGAPFNLNWNVRVKLTDAGLNALRARHDDLNAVVPTLGPFVPPKTDDEGFATFQLWALMQDLGPAICMGREVPFDTEIFIVWPHAASAIEARSDATGTGAAEGESAVPEGQTP